MTDTFQFPRVLTIWKPPLPSSPRWNTQCIVIDEAVDANDMLSAVALALRYHGSSQSATFYIVLPYGSFHVAFPSSDGVSLAYWRPELVHTSVNALVALRLNHSLSSPESVELAVSLSVPVLISQRSDVSSTHIRVTYDCAALSRSEAGWFLIHVTNALRSLRIHGSRDLISNLSLFSAPERFLFHDNVLARLLPPQLLFHSSSVLRSLRVRSNCCTITDVPLVSPSEQSLLGGDVAPKHNPRFWNESPHSSLLHDFFLERVRVDPLSIAFRSHHVTKTTPATVEITYALCHTIALRLALKLQSAGVQPRSVVPIILIHPVDIAVSMIAVLLAGAAYAILDAKTCDVAEIQECLSLGQVRSPVVLLHHELQDRFACVGTEFADPRAIVQNSLQNLPLVWEHNSPVALPSVVGEDIAVVTPSSHRSNSSVVTYFTHADAVDSLRTCFERIKITPTSTVLLMNDCPGLFFHGIIWNVLAVRPPSLEVLLYILTIHLLAWRHHLLNCGS
jgi:hypothetical protein